MRVLSIMPVYNEMQYLPLKVKWCQRENIGLYVLDNMSTDGSWEYAQDQQIIGCSRIDTDNAFDLTVLQAEMTRIVHELKPDWAILHGCDLFFVSDINMRALIKQAWRDGYNMIEFGMTFGPCNTGEDPEEFRPTKYYFYGIKGKGVALIHRVTPGFAYYGDSVQLGEEVISYKAPGCAFNFGMTKPREQREETLRRRQLAWDRGLRYNFGKHFRYAADKKWKWDPKECTDIRKRPEFSYYQKLDSILFED